MKLKEACLKCGYWDKNLGRAQYYKCYAGDCPAKARDDRISRARLDKLITKINQP